ncbi:MAG TPA: hypothetical protein VD793_00215 [Gemmatimonadales bacterium]|nr:hypothetical protein [Gemmatimonadales bacterium]
MSRRTRSMLIMLALAGGAVPGAVAQAPLRYRPQQGTVLHAAFNARATLVYREVVGGVVSADSLLGEYTALGAIGQRVVDLADPVRVLDVRLDSLRVRARLQGQAWREAALVDSTRPTFRLRVDDRLRFDAAGGRALEQLGLARSFGWMGLEFPDEAVGPAGRWTARTVVRLPRELAALHEVGMPDSLEAVASVVLDSVSAQTSDTLFYLSFQGSIPAATVPGVDAGDSVSVSLAGAQAGSLIWSTAWQAFVGAASQARVRARVRVPPALGGREAELMWTVTTRLQVRL